MRWPCERFSCMYTQLNAESSECGLRLACVCCRLATRRRNLQMMHTDCYCTQLRRASSGVTKIYDDALRPQGLRITQFSMLRGLARLGQATLTELSNDLPLNRTTITPTLNPLIAPDCQ